MSPISSGVWNHFEKIANSKNVRCTIPACNKELKRSDTSTAGMWSHLKCLHLAEYEALRNGNNGNAKSENKLPKMALKKRKFIDSYATEFDGIKRAKNDDEFHCISCNEDFSLGEAGKNAIVQHFATEKHNKNEEKVNLATLEASKMSDAAEPMTETLFVQLMAQFFGQGWMVGSSGGMAATKPDGTLLVSPSSVNKERLKESDLFVLDTNIVDNMVQHGPAHLNQSACTPLFLLLIRSSPGCHCVIHTHSKYANLVTIFEKSESLVICDQEMLKGVLNRQTGKPLRNTDTLELPIVENAPEERDLLPALEGALNEFPEASAILVRRHGLFVWGPSWQKTKVMLECLEYLLEIEWEKEEMVRRLPPPRPRQLARKGC